MIDPIAFNIGNTQIKWYGIMMVLALTAGFLLWKKLAKEQGFNGVKVLEYYIWVIIGLFIGNRIFHIVVHNFDSFILNPLNILFAKNGFASHGGIIGGTLAAFLFCKKNKLDFWKWADVSIAGVALAAGFVRIGNFINGEIVGRITSVPWAVEFNNYTGKRHPVQLYEAFKNFFVFTILYYMRNLNLPKGFIYWSFIFLFSFLRFFTEFFKEYSMFSSGLTIGQWLSLLFTIISSYFLIKLYKIHSKGSIKPI